MTNLTAWNLSQDMNDARVDCPDEAAFHALWKREHLAQMEPASMAFRGGYISDRLPWVFLSGYQAAIHHTFPSIPKEGWTSFAASEDKKDPKANPPSKLALEESGGILNGTKSWIAASAHVDWLLVLARQENSERPRKHCVLIASDTPGVTLSHRKAPSFLGSMSQGYARFSGVMVERDNCFDEDQARGFGSAEPPFIMLASAGFLLQKLGDDFQDLKDGLIEIATGLSALCQSGTWTAKRLAYLDRKLQAAVAAFEEVIDPSSVPDWEADRMLLSLYSKKLQAAAED